MCIFCASSVVAKFPRVDRRQMSGSGERTAGGGGREGGREGERRVCETLQMSSSPRSTRKGSGRGAGWRRGRKVSAFLPESFTCFERVIVCKDLTLGRLRRTDFDVSNGLCIRPPTKLECTSFFPRGAFYFPLRIIRRIKAPRSAPPPSICGTLKSSPV